MIDIEMTEDGDLVVGNTGDLAIVYGDEEIAQEVLFRLKTTLGDWTLSPQIGADLERFIGEPNIPITHSLMENQIAKAIVRDNLIFAPSVRAVPIGENEVFILVEFGSLEDDERTIQVQAGLDLRKGLIFSRIGTRHG
jgi:phage baseplate assembly protein W